MKISSFLEENFGLSISENTTQISGAIFRGGTGAVHDLLNDGAYAVGQREKRNLNKNYKPRYRLFSELGSLFQNR